MLRVAVESIGQSAIMLHVVASPHGVGGREGGGQAKQNNKDGKVLF